MNVPHHERYNWRIMARNNRVLLTGIWIALILAMIAAVGIGLSARPAKTEYVPVPIYSNAQMRLDIMRCESGMKHDAIGDDGVSRGIAQFRKETFYEFSVMAIRQGAWDFGKLGKPEWLNPMQQEFLLGWGLDNGYERRWTCWRTLYGGAIK